MKYHYNICQHSWRKFESILLGASTSYDQFKTLFEWLVVDVLCYAKHPEAAKDLASDFILSFLEYTQDNQRKPVSTWYAATIHQLLEVSREKAHAERIYIHQLARDYSFPLAERDPKVSRVLRLSQLLKKEEEMVVHLTLVDSLCIAEIAGHLNIPESTVRDRLASAAYWLGKLIRFNKKEDIAYLKKKRIRTAF